MDGKHETREVKHLTQQQVARFFAAIPKGQLRERLLFGFIYRFGMRGSEACELPAAALDRERWEITIQGKKHGLRRTYSVPEDLRRLLRRYKADQPTLFTGRQGPLTYARVWQLWKRYAKLAGIPEDFGVHALRHSCAVHALDAGLTTDDVRDLLRHRHVATTEVYASLSVRRRGDYLSKLEQSGAMVKIA